MIPRTFVDGHRFIYTTDIEHDETRTFVTVHWIGLPFAPEEGFLRPLRDYLEPRHEVAEVWLVFPSDLTEAAEALRSLERFPSDEASSPRVYRLFSVELNGQFTECGAADPAALETTSDVVDAALADGLRQLFRDADALASASAGFHFAHPGGSHSSHFIRASQTAARVQHSYFVAMTLLSTISWAGDGVVWVDTAGISPTAYAFADLLRRYRLTPRCTVESFGGHDGLTERLNPGESDYVLVSGSTSGTLARRAITEKRMPPAHVVTLFYLCTDSYPDDAGTLLCDLTNRDTNYVPSVRDARKQPYKAVSKEDCEHCRNGYGIIQLDGDSFFPAPGPLDLRMPGLADRPLNKQRWRPQSDITKFDGQNYFADLFGHGAITYDPGTAVEGSPYAVSTRLSHLLVDPTLSPTKRVVASLEKAAADAEGLSVVLSLLDEDSSAVGRLAASLLLGEAAEEFQSTYWRGWRVGGDPDLNTLDNKGVVLVCAGVVGSGRKLAALSRELRKIKVPFERRYYVAAAHPESSTTWTILTDTLGRVSSTGKASLTLTWCLPREPRAPREASPWRRERTVLEHVGSWRGVEDDAGSLEARLQQLGALSDDVLFVGASSVDADVRMPQINNNFALWPFEWGTHTAAPAGAVPSHAEVYATVAHLLYESRRLSPQVDKKTITARRHGYALHPAMFDRYNDPVIQAAVLRAAEPGELHYDLDADASRAMADVLCYVLANLDNEAGAASYEFLMLLVEGRDLSSGHGLRLDARSFARFMEDVQTRYGSDFERVANAPRVQALLRYLASE